MLTIDGSRGEGGGQVLRSALTLAMATGRPFTIENIRRNRKKPGLMRQHLAAVEAAQAVSGAEVRGGELGATTLTFAPGTVHGGEHRFAIATAGSTTLVLQTVLPVLLTAAEPSRLCLEGGTHNPQAPPFDFLARAYLPLVERLGPRVRASLERHGFYPAGGGLVEVEIEPVAALGRLELMAAGKVRRRSARAVLANLPRHIAERELGVVAKRTGWPPDALAIEEVGSPGPGNALFLELASEHVTEVFTGFGQMRVSAETVAAGAVRALKRYQKAGVPVGEHLADQLVVLLALAGGGRFRTLPLSRHATTQLDLVRLFLDLEVAVEPAGESAVTVRLGDL